MGKEVETYFFDTYAFYEILGKNKNYTPYLKKAIITTKMNLMELHYGLIRMHGEEAADRHYDTLVKYCVDVDDDIIKKSTRFKAINKDSNLSYIDCIGYVLALMRGAKFLTGDNAFKGMPNVEFVK